MVREVERQFGPVDLLVNNAGHGGQIGPFWEIDPDDWWRCIDVNLRGPFLCSRAIVPSMIARGHGRIVNVSSVAALQPFPNWSDYGVSKTALLRFSAHMAGDTKEHGISVFAIHPGVVRTALSESAFLSDATRKWFPEWYDWFANGGGETPERATELVLLLASGRADALSGCYLSIDDDVAEMVSRAEEIQQDDLYRLRLRT
jgi:NAD(P)-dependent dehydrogenase (short-subunit alcohol dehydrogenase family)